MSPPHGGRHGHRSRLLGGPLAGVSAGSRAARSGLSSLLAVLVAGTSGPGEDDRRCQKGDLEQVSRA